MRRLLERLDGHGQVISRSDGEILGRAGYHLQVWQKYIVARTLAGTDYLPGLKSVEGRIEGIRDPFIVGRELKLQLEDGRCFDFFVTDATGRIAPQGGLYKGPDHS